MEAFVASRCNLLAVKIELGLFMALSAYIGRKRHEATARVSVSYADQLVLLARFLAVCIPVVTLRSRQDFVRGTIPVLTWGGLRGGISVALARSLPEVPEKPSLLAGTYAVVVFTIVVQGLSLRWLVRRTVAA